MLKYKNNCEVGSKPLTGGVLYDEFRFRFQIHT